MAIPFPPTVDLLIDGKPVDAGTTNVPLSQLANRTLSNKERIDAIAARGALISLPDVPVDDAVLDSQLVYWDAITEKLKVGIAELTAAGAPPEYVPTARCYVLGIAQNIRGTPGAKICDLHIRGLVPSINTTNFLHTGEAAVYGEAYYLTVLAAEIGRATSSRPGLRVFVGILRSDDSFFLDPDIQSLGEDHLHQQATLDPDEWLDLGTPLALTGTLTFTPSTTTVTGVGTLFTSELAAGNIIRLDADDYWVRIDHIVSDTELVLVKDYDSTGGAGAGTKADGPWVYPGTLLSPWPAIPFTSVVMVVNGSVMTFGVEYTADLDGVHWLDQDFPFSHNDFEAQIFWVFPLGKTAPGVTRLKSGTPSVLIENCSPGGPTDSGDLKVSVIPRVDLLSSAQSGSSVLKSLAVSSVTGDLQAKFGPVVEKLVAGVGVKLTPVSGQGSVRVDVTALDEIIAPLPEILLRNTKQSWRNVTPYIEMREGVRSGFMAKIRLPEVINVGEPFQLIFEMLGESSISSSAQSAVFTVKYNVIDPTAADSLSKATLSLTSTVVFPFPYTAYSTFKTIAAQIPGSQLIPNGTLSMLVERDDVSDTYTGNVGIVNPLYRVKLT